MADEIMTENVSEDVQDIAAEETVAVESAEAAVEAQQASGKADAAPASSNIKQGGDNAPHWYVVHTYSGYENKVKADIEKTIENRRLQEQMFDVMVPVQEVTEMRNGTRKTLQKKMFPGYVLVHMILNDVTWYVVRNTRGVTGFVGPGSEPVPLTDTEMRMFGVKTEEIEIDVAIGDKVRIIGGAWDGTIVTVKAVNATKQTIIADMDIFGRQTDLELELGDVIKL